MFFKNTLFIYKAYQLVLNRSLYWKKWPTYSGALVKIRHGNICEVNLKLHSAAILSSEKTNEKPQYKVKKIVTEDGIVKVQKKINIPRITLFTSENGMEILTLEEAKKIANRRNLKLVQVSDVDPKTGRPIYKLSSASVEKPKNKADKNKNTKDEKSLGINSNISEHDLQSKLKNILKWLNKDHTIKVSISGDVKNAAPAEKIFNIIDEGVVNVGRIVQKNTKNGEIKFQIIQPKKPSKKESGMSDKVSIVTEELK